MGYNERAWTKATKVQEVLGKVMRGELNWYRAAAVLGVSPRQLRRLYKDWQERE
jgi:hypothetical protein